jgi:hypothetical protein
MEPVLFDQKYSSFIPENIPTLDLLNTKHYIHLMKQIMLFVMLLWILVTVEICMSEPPAHPSPGSSGFGKSISVYPSPPSLNRNFLEHYASSEFTSADKPFLGLANFIPSQYGMGELNQRIFGMVNSDGCSITYIMLSIATHSVANHRLFGIQLRRLSSSQVGNVFS